MQTLHSSKFPDHRIYTTINSLWHQGPHTSPGPQYMLTRLTDLMRYAVWPILGSQKPASAYVQRSSSTCGQLLQTSEASASRSEAERKGMRNDQCNAARAGEGEAERPRIGGRLKGISAPEHV